MLEGLIIITCNHYWNAYFDRGINSNLKKIVVKERTKFSVNEIMQMIIKDTQICLRKGFLIKKIDAEIKKRYCKSSSWIS